MHPNSIAPSLTGLGFYCLRTHSQHEETGFVDKKPTLLGCGWGNKLKRCRFTRDFRNKTRFLPKEADRKLAGVAGDRPSRREESDRASQK
ncbi:MULTISPECIES: hypothetical protein [unclassified Microcoleus]|uniref:hypothetical protein n=1 Tax=unclassified Microcoleus TaxID=2642155 RepID=UPI002FD4ECDB